MKYFLTTKIATLKPFRLEETEKPEVFEFDNGDDFLNCIIDFMELKLDNPKFLIEMAYAVKTPIRKYKYIAYVDGDCKTRFSFTFHNSIFAAEKKHGDLSSLYKGGASSDYSLTIYEWDDFIKEIEGDEDIIVHWNKQYFEYKQEEK